jgi:hypothetical protein
MLRGQFYERPIFSRFRPRWMSELGHKQTFAVQTVMSALPPKADIRSAQPHVCNGPEADKCNS